MSFASDWHGTRCCSDQARIQLLVPLLMKLGIGVCLNCCLFYAVLHAGILECLVPYRIRTKHMIEEKYGALTAVENGERRGWQVYKSAVQFQRPSGEELIRLRQLGHIRLLKGAVCGTETDARVITIPPREGIHTNERSMPKRQHLEKQSYRDDDRRPGETNGPEANAFIPNIKREFMLTQSADETLYNAVRLLSGATGSNLSNSHFFRIFLKCIAHAMPELRGEASKLGRLQRPSNWRGKEAEREEYE